MGDGADTRGVLHLKAFAAAAEVPYTTMSWWRPLLRDDGPSSRLSIAPRRSCSAVLKTTASPNGWWRSGAYVSKRGVAEVR